MAVEPILIKPRDLPEAANVYADSVTIVDDGVRVQRATPSQVVDAGAPVASQASAIAGENNTERMTPLRVKQVLDNVNAPSVQAAIDAANLAQRWAALPYPDEPDPENQPGELSARGYSHAAGISAGSAQESANRAQEAASSVQPFPNRSAVVTAAATAPSDVLLLTWVGGGGVLTVSRSPGAIDIPDMPGWVPSGDASPHHWNVAADGATNDRDALQLAANWMLKGNRIVDRSGATYAISGAPIGGTGPVSWDHGSSSYNKLDGGDVFSFSDTAPSARFALTSNYVDGATTLPVAALPSAPVPGTRIRVYSMGVDPMNRDTGSQPAYYGVGEWAFVGIGSTTTNIVLAAPLRFTEAIEPWGSSSARVRVPSYTTALSAGVVVMADEHSFYWSQNVSGDHPGIEYTSGNPAHRGAGLRLNYYAGPEIKGFRETRGHTIALYLGATVTAVVSHPRISNLTDDTPNGNYGYGVGDAGYLTTVNGGVFEKLRHSYTTVETTINPASLTTPGILCTGRIVGAQINFSKALRTTAGAFDTHQAAHDVTFTACQAIDCAAHAFGVRGQNVTLVDPMGINCQSGILVATEWNSGYPNPGHHTAGKLESDATNCIIVNPHMDVQGVPLTVALAKATVTGTATLWGKTPQLLKVAGELIVEGNVTLSPSPHLGAILPGNTDSSLLMEVLNPVSAAIWGVTKVNIGYGAELSLVSPSGDFAMDFGSTANEFLLSGRLHLSLAPGQTAARSQNAMHSRYGGSVVYAAEDYDGVTMNLPRRDTLEIMQASGVPLWVGRHGGTIAGRTHAWVQASGTQEIAFLERGRGSGNGISFALGSGANTIRSVGGRPLVVDAVGADVIVQRDGAERMRFTADTVVTVRPTYANNAAAVAGGLPVNGEYQTATGEVRVRV